MNIAFAPLRCLTLLALGSAAVGQSFAFPNFASLGGLTLNGDAVQNGSILRLTNGGSAETGSAFYTMPVSVAEGFETEFVFLLTTAPEGMAFVIQGSLAGDQALGGNLWGIGYGFGNTGTPITNSIAIEIDTMQDGFLNDTSANEVSIHTTGVFGNSENEGASIARITPPFDLSNNATHTMRVVYVPGTLDVYIDNMTTPLLSTAFTFENGGTQLTGGSTGGLGLTSNVAWVGFTSATSAGTGSQRAEIQSWNWDSQYLPDPCYVGNVLQGAGGPYDLLTINNTAGGFFRTVRLATADPWSVEIAPPPGEVSAPFVLIGTLGIADQATVTTTPWGSACFPPALIDIGGFVAPYSVSVPPGIALNLALTLQAVMATSSANPGQLELTNAVALAFAPGPAPTILSISANSAPVGSPITVTGTNFSPFATVDIGGVPVPITSLTAPSSLQFAMPAGVPCGSTLRVRNPDGAAATFAFNPTPTITSELNTTGPVSGMTTYIAVGQGYAVGTTVTIGGNPAQILTVTATTVVTRTPPGLVGPAPIIITTPGGCTVTSTFTYF